MDKIIIIAKNSNERKILEEKVNFEVIEYDSITQTGRKEWTESKLKDLDRDSRLFLLVHFGDVDSESGLCDRRKSWRKEINQENVVIIPISEGAHSEKANELYEKFKNDELPDRLNLDDYKNYWEKKCGDYSKKKIIPSVLPFCLCCESVYYKDVPFYEKKKGKILEHLKKIRNKINRPDEKDAGEVKEQKDRSNDGWYVQFPELKDTWERLLNLFKNKNELDDNALVQFIGLKEKREKVPIDNTGWLMLLKSLKEWVKTDS